MIPVFIIDDEESAIQILQHLLKHQDLPITVVGTARNGKEALHLLDETTEHIVFIDIQMPFLSGIELMEKFPQHKYVVVSAFSLFEYAQASIQQGAIDYLLKPIDNSALRTSLSRALGFSFHSHPVVNEVMSLLNSDFMYQISLTDIASKVNLDASYLARLYKRETGTTIIAELHEIRLTKAMDLLKNSQKDIQEIAYEIGYQNFNTFYRHFKRKYDMSPSKVREKYQI